MGRRGYVYFIEGEMTRLVKVGSAIRPWARLKELQTGSAEVLTLLGVIDCADRTEREAWLHTKFRRCRVRGEWFEPDEAMRAFMGAEMAQYHPPGITIPVAPQETLGERLSAAREESIRAYGRPPAGYKSPSFFAPEYWRVGAGDEIEHYVNGKHAL